MARWSSITVMYETFDHTADLGLRIRAGTLDALFAEAGRALFSVLVEEPEVIKDRVQHEIRINGEEREFLFFDWLNELLYRFETEKWLLKRFEVHLVQGGLSAVVGGEVYDPDRHVLAHEVKAITYHGLRIEKTEDGWLAEVIVDI